MALHHGLTLPIFGPLADPSVVARLAMAAEQAGFDGVFVWDHVLYRRDPDGPDPHGRADVPVADPWTTLAAMATVTDRVALGPMVTPLPRRRPQVLARQATSVDILAGGRLVMGVGLGGDGYGEFSAFGDEPDPRVRGAMLDDRLELLRELWTGDVVTSSRRHAVAADVQFLPTPTRTPPVWVAGRWPHRAPIRRAARFEGWFPIDLPDPDALAEGIDMVAAARGGDLAGFDVVVHGTAGDDPTPWRAAGATWWLTQFDPWHVTEEEVARAIAAGPAT
jgi:alkanesulfonate monooxygenase SsuD/methylene tetrahydromethanopterin reductase-like flavin-dependent oxidoreductase (luciferase family)